MKTTLITSTLTALFMGSLMAGDSFKDDLEKVKAKNTKPILKASEVLKKISTESLKTANDQDELSADVQDLIQEQTDEKLVKLLNEAEQLMNEATEMLEKKKTGGETIAIQTEIIEKIVEASKEKKG